VRNVSTNPNPSPEITASIINYSRFRFEQCEYAIFIAYKKKLNV